MWVLDSDTCVDLLRGRSPNAAHRVSQIDPEELTTTIINAAELRYGAENSSDPAGQIADLNIFLRQLKLLHFDMAAVEQFGKLKANMRRAGKMIGPMDLLIAGIVLANDATLVTNNVREFGRVPGLRLENWIAGPGT